MKPFLKYRYNGQLKRTEAHVRPRRTQDAHYLPAKLGSFTLFQRISKFSFWIFLIRPFANARYYSLTFSHPSASLPVQASQPSQKAILLKQRPFIAQQGQSLRIVSAWSLTSAVRYLSGIKPGDMIAKPPFLITLVASRSPSKMELLTRPLSIRNG